ncbi:MAG: succinate dehydrogenase, cytochrome b556 subunit [Gammaproteobacteria bacterium]|nr:succinate dehydrogenase, cytochrome b556 subunit [Gammaproteobacteria bacterium]
MARNDRPLSPHLSVYRWQISNTLSIIHRMTGFALSIGAMALVGWLVSVGSGPNAYASVNGLYGSVIGMIALFGWTFCFFYHLCNGIRHLFWDIGKGFEEQRAKQTGILVVVSALLLTVGLWAAILAG